MEFKCSCGNIYNHRQGLYKHRKSCTTYQTTLVPTQSTAVVAEVIKPAIELEELLEHYKQLIRDKDRLIEEKDKRIEEHKQTIDFLKTIATREPVQIMQPIQQAITPVVAPESTPVIEAPAKSFNLKEYLNSRNPITVNTFFDNYKPTIEEYDFILNNGIVNATIINFTNYAKSYGDQCPFVVSNAQYERLRIFVYEEENEWIEYDRIHAQMHMDKIIIRFVNKYFTYMSVFNNKYTDCMIECPSLLSDDNDDISKKNNLRISLCRADEYTDKICKEIAYDLSINRD